MIICLLRMAPPDVKLNTPWGLGHPGALKALRPLKNRLGRAYGTRARRAAPSRAQEPGVPGAGPGERVAVERRRRHHAPAAAAPHPRHRQRALLPPKRGSAREASVGGRVGGAPRHACAGPPRATTTAPGPRRLLGRRCTFSRAQVDFLTKFSPTAIWNRILVRPVWGGASAPTCLFVSPKASQVMRCTGCVRCGRPQEGRLTVFMGVPTMYNLLLAAYDNMKPEQQVRDGKAAGSSVRARPAGVRGLRASTPPFVAG